MKLSIPKPEKRVKEPKRLKRGKAPQRNTRPAKVRKTSLAALKRKLWERIKQYIRKTHGNTCYTCGAQGLEGSNWHTAHFVNAGASSAVRYDPDNLRPCCYRCNVSLHGNIANYALALWDEIGEAKVRSLLARSKPTKSWKAYEIEELIAALDKGGAEYELLYFEKYGTTDDQLKGVGHATFPRH